MVSDKKRINARGVMRIEELATDAVARDYIINCLSGLRALTVRAMYGMQPPLFSDVPLQDPQMQRPVALALQSPPPMPRNELRMHTLEQLTRVKQLLHEGHIVQCEPTTAAFEDQVVQMASSAIFAVTKKFPFS